MKKDNPRETNKDTGRRMLSVDTRRAAVGGVIATAVALGGVLVVNISSGSEAQSLLEGMLPSIRFLCSAVTTATATILALMLTMLSVSLGGEGQFKPSHYDRVRQIAFVDTGTFAAAIILLLLVSIPFSQSQNDVPTVLYTVLYYIVLGYAAVLGGALVSIVLMLYNAITDLISVGDPNQESHLLMDAD